MSASGNTSVIISVIATAITGAMTIYTTFENMKITAAKQVLEQRTAAFQEMIQSSELNMRQDKQNFDRFDFVQKLIPSMLSKEPKQQILTVNLIRLALGDKEARSFFQGIELIDKQPEIRALSTVAQETFRAVQNEKEGRIAALVGQLNADQKQKRLEAAGVLQSIYSSDSNAVRLLIDQIEVDNFKNLSDNGRINVLYTLKSMDNGAWNMAAIYSARQAVSSVKSALQSKTFNAGPQASALIEKIDKRSTF